tara:strand:+ start:687 stop:941 length:255 start_codon:yes stop_codon:yes gene_type:complete
MKLLIDFDITIKSNYRLIKTYIKRLHSRQKQQKSTIKRLKQELSIAESKVNELESKMKDLEPYVNYALAIMMIPKPSTTPPDIC